jgi:putative ABC transport system permease protein
MLYGVTAADPTTYAVAAVTMLVVAMVASYLPARRAMRADPLESLRSE